jgi:lipopolysaccharide/colanic/teichoic acid biosynthesis glycosyltransferase/NDP-sugar pyrophosphorylase family protein
MRRGAIARRPGATVSKAIILAGGDSTSVSVLTDARPKPLLPVLNRPLIEWQLQALLRSGIEEVCIALSPDNFEPVSEYLASRAAPEIRLHCAVDEVPRGPAGSMKLFERILERETFLVVDGGTFLGDVRIDALVRAHHARGAKATMGILPPSTTASSPEAVVSPDGRIQSIFQHNQSNDRRRSRPLTGLCVFDSAVLGLIPDHGFFDVKERLFGELQEQGALVAAETTHGLCVPIDNLERYYQLQVELLEGDFFAGSSYRQLADGIWVEEDVELSPSAYVLGPVVIGSHCRIEDGAQIVGPAVIGDGCRIGSRSFVRSSVLWEQVQLASGSKVENSIIASGASISEETWLRSSVLVPNGASHQATARFQPERPSPLPAPAGNGRSRTSMAAKAVLDFVGAGALLILLSPIFLLCAVAIRLDSPGPAFFRQRRCGKNGKPFSMFKFRTMVEDADEKQAELRKQNDTDGPVFKMFADPRITRVGRVMRRTSFDELPQLLNVLLGEMSLVGPRPLATDQMRYCPAWRDRRLSVKPGMTGLWQVNGRSRSKFHDWVRHDIEYVKRQSMGLDLRILAKTVVAVIRGSGAC